MIQRQIQVKNKIGLHARPASLFVTAAGRFQSVITVTKDDSTVGADSMIRLLALRIKMDDVITIGADGEDEEAAVQALCELIDAKFGEE